MDRNQAILMIAGRVQEKCTEAVLKWGDAIRRARQDPTNTKLEEDAREAGRFVATLGATISEGLGRTL